MQTAPMSVPQFSYDLLIFSGVCVVALAFMIWFLIGLIFDIRKAHRRQCSSYRTRIRYWVHILADRDYKEEIEYAGHTLDSRDDRVFRDLDRLRPLLRSCEMRTRSGKAN